MTNPRRTTNICMNCSQSNAIGDFYCQFCGKALMSNKKTIGVAIPSYAEISQSAASKAPTQPDKNSLMIQIIDHNITLVIQPKPQITLGRTSDAQIMDINLVPFDGFARGVSKFHASIQNTLDGKIYLVDQGSKNGTFLNGVQLEPYQLYDIQDQDIAHIGTLPIQFIFS